MIPRARVMEKLDSFFRENDYAAAKRLLKYWLSEAEYEADEEGVFIMQNELMGLCRKLGEKEEAVKFAHDAQDQIRKMGIEDTVTGATAYLNSATVYKAFGEAEKALPLFQKARDIYERDLSSEDERLAGLYNNMGLALVDLKKFEDAKELYEKAIAILKTIPEKEPEEAITYLNMASALEAEFGLAEAKEEIASLAEKAKDCMEIGKDKNDGNYAFVCEKCASVFGFYGFEEYARILKERSGRIYERA